MFSSGLSIPLSFGACDNWLLQGTMRGNVPLTNKCNHKELVAVIARYDALLAEHMELSVFSGIIQNGLIASIASSIKS